MYSIELKKDIEKYIDETISLVASESLLYPEIKEALASTSHQLTVEGTANKRYFSVPDELNKLEIHTKKRFIQLFNKAFCDIRSTTATHANISIYLSVLKPGDTILSLNINSGGHISHGHNHSIAGRLFKIEHYCIEEDGTVDLKKLELIIKKYRPQLLISGGSSCPREFEHDLIAKLCHQYNVMHLADISHSVGLIAAGVLKNNLYESDFVTFGTQKTFLGPRGGIILSKNKYSKQIEQAIFPGIEGAMLIPQIIAKSLAVEYAFSHEFRKVQNRILEFSKILANKLLLHNVNVVTKGSDNHLVLVKTEEAKKIVNELEMLGLRCNLNPIPNSSKWGIRFGTTSLAQSILTKEEVTTLFDNLAKHISIRSCLTKQTLQENINNIISSKRHLLHQRESGNFVKLEDVDNREKVTSNILINKKINKSTEYAPLVKFVKTSESFFDKNPTTVIIPTIGVDNQLANNVEYSRRIGNKVNVLIIDSSFNNNKLIEKVNENIYNISLSYFTKNMINLEKLTTLFGFNQLTNKGKGWSMFLGYIISFLNEIQHVYFIDADLQDVNKYDPLNRLTCYNNASTNISHAVIATPNRRNEVLHSVLNAFEIQNPELIHRAKQYIHFLAGERYLFVDSYKNMPWMTNYGIETWINLFSSSKDIKTIQISNEHRNDSTNSYIKNEVMLMYCSKLISHIVNSKILDNYSVQSIINFNRHFEFYRDVSILPLTSTDHICNYRVNTDCLIPSYFDLRKLNIINNNTEEFLLEKTT